MPRQTQLGVTQRGVMDPISRPEATKVVARPTDQLEVPAIDPELTGLIEGLKGLNPELQRYSRIASMVDADTDTRAGAAARLKGEVLAKGSPEYMRHGYQVMDGQVKGDLDGKAVEEAYHSEFDKDAGDIDAFLREKFQGLTKGVNDKSFLEGYNQNIIKHLQGVRQGHYEYQKQAVAQRIESNAMVKLDKYLRPFAESSQPIPDDGVEQMRGDLKDFFNVSGSRFNDLLFASLRRLGDEGNHSVYEMLKRPRPDGTPGMYYIPGWKEKIDQAQLHAQNVSISRSKAADAATRQLREDDQDTKMYEVFAMMDSDPEGAKTKYNQLRSSGLFTRASELIDWDAKFLKTANREARSDQQLVELDLLQGVHTGGVRPQHILAADLTPQQKRSLMGDWYRVQNDRKQAAAAGAKAVDSVFKTEHYDEAKDYIKTILRPTSSPLDVMGIGTEFQRSQLATALRELNDVARKVKDPSELTAKSHDIVSRYQDRAKDPRIKKELDGAGRIRYITPQEAKVARDQGLLTDEELLTHITYYKASKKDPSIASR